MRGAYMAAEMREGADVFARAVRQDVGELAKPAAIYTFARGSSDTVANILSYAFMDRLGVPMTSLPPSVFSLGNGVAMEDALALVVSQSGASDDLVACAKNAPRTVAITNVEGSDVERHSEQTIRIGAGPERSVPATKTVIGAIGAGMALLSALDAEFKTQSESAADCLQGIALPTAQIANLAETLSTSQHIYVLGRQCSYGVAQEVALKLKETCALHAEAYSASEVLHGPIQLASNPMTVLVLDAGDAESQASLDIAEARFRDEGAKIFRIGPAELRLSDQPAVAMAAALLFALYPVVYATANTLGVDPDAPKMLSKVTRTQ